MGTPIGYFTDVEGNWNFFLKCVEMSRVLDWDGKELILKDDACVVFGGDGGDKQNRTLTFYTAMVNLKKKHPNRVFLILGNRDCNKLRLLSELEDSDVYLDVPLPTGITGDVKTYRQFLQSYIVSSGKRASADQVTDQDLQEHCTKATKMRWILDCTMGAQGDFEFRRQELAHMWQRDTSSVTDDEVLKSYMDSMTDNGCVLEFLRLGQLGCIIDETLFVHGGIFGIFSKDKGLESCVGRVPGNVEHICNVHDWVLQLNAWCSAQIESCVSDPHWKENRSKRNGEGLIFYSAYTDEPSVIMAKPLNNATQPAICPSEVSAHLKENGIHRVVVGHTPHGTCPTVIRDDEFETLLCDTSYSDMKAEDNRGAAAWEVFVQGPRAEVQGILPDSRRYAYTLAAPGHSIAGADPYVGRGPRRGFWVKAKMEDVQGEYLLCRVEGRTYEYKYVNAAEVASVLQHEAEERQQ